jgi:hypothetical protein
MNRRVMFVRMVFLGKTARAGAGEMGDAPRYKGASPTLASCSGVLVVSLTWEEDGLRATGEASDLWGSKRESSRGNIPATMQDSRAR